MSSLLLLLLMIVVSSITSLDSMKSTLHLSSCVHNRHYSTGTHSVAQKSTTNQNKNPAVFNNRNDRFSRDVPASSYFIPPPLGASFGAVPETNVVIIKETEENNYNGIFTNSYETTNGITVELKGYPKTLNTGIVVQVMEGKYSYTAPDGTPITTQWYADETGFHAEGAHIPGSAGRT